VHARANVLALTSPVRGDALLRALNGLGPELWFTGATERDDAFRVRSARSRTYRYLEPREGKELARWREAASWFHGPIDVRAFSKRLPQDVASVRDVSSVTVSAQGRWLRVTVKAPSFVWGMVRKIVSALRSYDAGRISAEELRAALRGERGLALPLAEPEGLVLWSVDLGLRFRYQATRGSRRQEEGFRANRARAEMRAELLASLDPWEQGRRGRLRPSQA
jgi:tRNA pseudouridine(38-40) synthase